VALGILLTICDGSRDATAPNNSSVDSSNFLPAEQQAFLLHFAQACEEYKAQPNEIRKSAVYRDALEIYSRPIIADDWIGLLRRISTNQGGSTATLVIRTGESDFYARTRIGSLVYVAASDIAEGQEVVFSGTVRENDLPDAFETERRKVCNPTSVLQITSLHRVGDDPNTAANERSDPATAVSDATISNFEGDKAARDDTLDRPAPTPELSNVAPSAREGSDAPPGPAISIDALVADHDAQVESSDDPAVSCRAQALRDLQAQINRSPGFGGYEAEVRCGSLRVSAETVAAGRVQLTQFDDSGRIVYRRTF
jgi:hypothetical protein